MTSLYNALAAVKDDRAKVVGLWLAAQSGIPSISPQQGMLLTLIARQVNGHAKGETDPVIQTDLRRFVAALDFICQVEMIHQGAAIDQLERMTTGGSQP